MFEEKLAVVLVLVGFYLADCVIFLRPTQALGCIVLPWHCNTSSFLSRRRRKPARRARPGSIIGLNFGLTFYPTRGYFPALLNPFTPWVATFKTAPMLPSVMAGGAARPVPAHRLVGARLLLRLMAVILAIHAGLLFGALPWLLFRGDLDRLLLTLAFTFLTAASIVALSYPLTRILCLRRSQYWSLAIQALICLPLSLNLPRKLALLAPGDFDAAKLMPRVPLHEKRRVAQDFMAVLEYARNGRIEAGEATDLSAAQEQLRRMTPDE